MQHVHDANATRWDYTKAMTPAEAVLALRNALSELEGKRISQQEFSNRLGVAVRSVAGYESGANPTGRVLLGLARLARQHGQFKLERQFLHAFFVELGTASDSFLSGASYPAGESSEPAMEYVVWSVDTTMHPEFRDFGFALTVLLQDALADHPEARESLAGLMKIVIAYIKA